MAAAILLIVGGAGLGAVAGLVGVLWLDARNARRKFLDDVLAQAERERLRRDGEVIERVADTRTRIVRLSDRQVRATRD